MNKVETRLREILPEVKCSPNHGQRWEYYEECGAVEERNLYRQEAITLLKDKIIFREDLLTAKETKNIMKKVPEVMFRPDWDAITIAIIKAQREKAGITE